MDSFKLTRNIDKDIEHCIDAVNYVSGIVEEVKKSILEKNRKEDMQLFIYFDSLNTSMRKAKNDAEHLSWILGARR